MSDNSTFVYRVTIRGAIEDVWREITKTDELQKAVYNSWMECKGVAAGSPLRMRTPSRKYTMVAGEILEVAPPHRYVHTMQLTQFDDPPWKVIHELKKVAGGVEYSMTLEGLKPGSRAAKNAAAGAKFIADNLKALVESGRPPLGTRVMYAMFGVMEGFLPKRCRSEAWPL